MIVITRLSLARELSSSRKKRLRLLIKPLRNFQRASSSSLKLTKGVQVMRMMESLKFLELPKVIHKYLINLNLECETYTAEQLKPKVKRLN